MIEKDLLRRTINLPTATSMVIGGVIGSGIFIRPAEMAALLGSPFLIFFIWVVSGLLNLLSAMVTAEIGGMFPETGGQYVFIRKIYGDFWAFIYGWAAFSVINTAGTAAVAFICAEYLQYFFVLPRFAPEIEQTISIHLPFVGSIFPLENFGLKMLTIAILGLFTWTSYRSTKLGGSIQLLSTILKLAAIAFLILGLFFSGAGSLSNFTLSSAHIAPEGYAMVAAMVAACTGAFQAYDGWGVMVNVAGEIRQPQKNIPNGLIFGLLTCMFIYIAVTASIVYILPVDAMAHSTLVAADAAKKAFGFAGGGLVAIMIVLSVFGTTNANVMGPPRMTFAMAHEGHFFRIAGRIHPAFKTPGNALVIHFIWMGLFVLSGSFFMLADMSVFIVWSINLMILFGIFVLRRKMPGAPRPYKMGGYPWLPLIVLLFNLFYLGFTLYSDIHNYLVGKTVLMNSVLGLIISALGIPFYFYFRRTYKNSDLAGGKEPIH